MSHPGPIAKAMKSRWIVAAYLYSLLHVACWRVVLAGNGNELWEGPFSRLFGACFFPLNVMTVPLCTAVWGTFNVFQARVVFGLVVDFAIASLLSTSVVVAAVALALRVRRRRLSIHV